MSDLIKVIIVDDEERASDVLSNLIISFCPQIKIEKVYNNLTDAVAGIKQLQPSLVFLDIEMSNYSGYEIVNFFDEINFEIIFVTAYDSYAIKAFEVAAVDYLLKPVEISRLKKSVDKAVEKIKNKNIAINYSVLVESLESKIVKSIVVSEKGNQCIIPTDKIIAIEAQESYSTLYTAERKYTASKNLKHFEKLLTDNKNFFRSHKSWIIDMKSVKNYSRSSGEILLNQNITAKLSKYRLDEFEQTLKG